MSTPLPITPETRIGDLLEAYPGLEEVLIGQAPAFKALKNPILRRTVARVATLEKAAQVGGVPVRQLVAALRQAAGLGFEDVGPEPESPPSAEARPEWLDETKVRAVINADELLATGQVPLTRIQSALQAMAPGDLLRLVSIFRPAPLIEALQRGGHSSHVQQISPELFHTYVCRAGSPGA